MKKTALLVAALVAGSSVYAQEAAEASSVSVTLDNTLASEYIFRGKELADLTFHPSLEVAAGDAYVGVWGAIGTRETGFNVVALVSNEFDFYAGYGFAINEEWSLDAGVTYYTYTNDGLFGANLDTIEPYLGLNGSLADFSVSLYYYYDLQIDDGVVQSGLGYSLPLEAIGSSLDLSATLGYVDGDGVENVTVVDHYWYYGVGAAVPYQLTDTATLTAAINYTDVSEDAINDGGEITLTVGLSVGF